MLRLSNFLSLTIIIGGTLLPLSGESASLKSPNYLSKSFNNENLNLNIDRQTDSELSKYSLPIKISTLSDGLCSGTFPHTTGNVTFNFDYVTGRLNFGFRSFSWLSNYFGLKS